MALILGGLALVIALIAMWLVGDARRMITGRNTEFLQAHIKPIKDAATENRHELNEHKKDIKRYRDIIETLSERISEIEDKNRDMTIKLKSLASEQPSSSQKSGRKSA